MKNCSACKQDKDESQFSRNRSRKDGLEHSCKACRAIRDKAYYEANRSDILERKAPGLARWYEENKERHIKNVMVRREKRKSTE